VSIRTLQSTKAQVRLFHQLHEYASFPMYRDTFLIIVSPHRVKTEYIPFTPFFQLIRQRSIAFIELLTAFQYTDGRKRVTIAS